MREAREAGAPFKGVDDQIGLAAERFVHDVLAARGVVAASGDYTHPVAGAKDEHGECDAVIETTERVVFMEAKKKALTRAASTGGDLSVLSDLGASLFDAQLQAGHHERRLLEVGSLRFDDGTTVVREGRRVERVALTLLDYGGFQDRTVLNHVLNLLRGVGLSTVREPTEKEQNSLDRLTETYKELEAQFAALAELDPARAESARPFFNCWFLSIPQLLVVLDGVTSPQEFEERIGRLRHATTGTLDLYYELSMFEPHRRAGTFMGLVGP